MIKQCEWCGREYETDLYYLRFCSDECYQAYTEEKKSRLIKCEVCGELFHPGSSRAKYCCDECRKTAHDKQIKQWHKEHRKELNEKQRIKRKKYPEQYKKYNRRSYLKHREERQEYGRERSKQYYYTHKEQVKAYWRSHIQENRDSERRRYWNKKIEACKAEHDNCFSCPTLDGECLFD